LKRESIFDGQVSASRYPRVDGPGSRQLFRWDFSGQRVIAYSVDLRGASSFEKGEEPHQQTLRGSMLVKSQGEGTADFIFTDMTMTVRFGGSDGPAEPQQADVPTMVIRGVAEDSSHARVTGFGRGSRDMVPAFPPEAMAVGESVELPASEPISWCGSLLTATGVTTIRFDGYYDVDGELCAGLETRTEVSELDWPEEIDEEAEVLLTSRGRCYFNLEDRCIEVIESAAISAMRTQWPVGLPAGEETIAMDADGFTRIVRQRSASAAGTEGGAGRKPGSPDGEEVRRPGPASSQNTGTGEWYEGLPPLEREPRFVARVASESHPAVRGPADSQLLQWDFARERTIRYEIVERSLSVEEDDRPFSSISRGLLLVKSRGGGTADMVFPVTLQSYDTSEPRNWHGGPARILQGMRQDSEVPNIAGLRVGPTFPVLPQNPVRVGDRAEHPEKFAFSFYSTPLSAEGTSETVLDGYYGVGKHTCARLDIRTEISELDMPAEIGGALRISIVGVGRCYFNLVDRCVEEYEFATVLSQRMRAPTGELNASDSHSYVRISRARPDVEGRLTRLLERSELRSNEAAAVGCLRQYIGAQMLFRRKDRYGNGRRVFANPVDGSGLPDLFNVVAREDRMLNEGFARATTPENALAGYYYKDIPADRNGRRYDFSVNCGLCAVPADHGRSGNHTFIIEFAQQGTVYRKDNGGKPVSHWPDTRAEGWASVE
jgi:hypothetical protein